MNFHKVFTTKAHGTIEGHHYGDKQLLEMITEYKALKVIPKKYELIDSTSDITRYTQPLTKKVNKRSDHRIFMPQLIKDLQSGAIVRVGAHVFKYDEQLGQYQVFHKIKMV